AQDVGAEQRDERAGRAVAEACDYCRQREAAEHDDRAHSEQRTRVSEAPGAGELDPSPPRRRAGRQRRHRGDVVGLERVPQSEQEAEREQRGEHPPSLAREHGRTAREALQRAGCAERGASGATKVTVMLPWSRQLAASGIGPKGAAASSARSAATFAGSRGAPTIEEFRILPFPSSMRRSMLRWPALPAGTSHFALTALRTSSR